MEYISTCLKIAELAYYTIEKWDIKDVIYKQFNSCMFDLVHVYHYYENDDLYISIRGSDCFSDILDDIDIYKVNFEELKDEKIYVHKGFYTDFCEIKNYIEEIINNKKINSIYLTGHSKGSAIATLTSIYIASIFNNIKIYNIGFGCPRVGCEKFINYYNKLLSETTYLIRTEKDIVPQLPIYDYYDVTNQYIIENNKIVLYKPKDSIENIIHSNFEYHKLCYYKFS